MDLQGLAQSTVDRIAESIAQHGTDVAGRLTDTTLNGLYRLIAQRLQSTATGAQLLDSLVRAPEDDRRRARVAEMISEAAALDPEFASSLRQAASQTGVLSVGPGSSYQQNIENHSGGDQFRNIGGNVTNKRFHIGNVNFGFGWLAIGVVATALLITGGVTVVGARKDAVNLTSLMGEWGGPGGRPIPGVTARPASLTVSANGDFSLSTGLSLDFFPGGDQLPAGAVPGSFRQSNFDCSGIVTPDGDHFTFRGTSGPCGTFQAAFGPNSNVLDVYVFDQSEGGSTPFTRIK